MYTTIRHELCHERKTWPGGWYSIEDPFLLSVQNSPKLFIPIIGKGIALCWVSINGLGFNTLSIKLPKQLLASLKNKYCTSMVHRCLLWPSNLVSQGHIWPTINVIWVSQMILGCCHKTVLRSRKPFQALLPDFFAYIKLIFHNWAFKSLPGFSKHLSKYASKLIAFSPSPNHYWPLVNQKGLICVSIAVQLLICVADIGGLISLSLLEDFFFWFLLEETASFAAIFIFELTFSQCNGSEF